MCHYILVFLMSFHCNFFVCLVFFVSIGEFFTDMETITNCGEGLQILTCSYAALMAMHWAVMVHQLWHGTSVLMVFEDLALTLTPVAEQLVVEMSNVLRNTVYIHDIYTCKNKLHEQDWTAGKMPIIVLSCSGNITTCTND